MKAILPATRLRHIAITFAIALELPGAGCGAARLERVPVHRVRGTVSFRGRPLSSALVIFHPADPASARGQVPIPTGRSAQDGSFQLTTYGGNDGAPAGRYFVGISSQPESRIESGLLATKSRPRPDVLGARYRDPKTSGLTAQVQEGDNQLPPFDLK
jgi:hypothetical protein